MKTIDYDSSERFDLIDEEEEQIHDGVHLRSAKFRPRQLAVFHEDEQLSDVRDTSHIGELIFFAKGYSKGLEKRDL